MGSRSSSPTINISKDEQISSVESSMYYEANKASPEERESCVRFGRVKEMKSPRRRSVRPLAQKSPVESSSPSTTSRSFDLGRGDYCGTESVNSFAAEFARSHEKNRKLNYTGQRNRSGRPKLYVNCYNKDEFEYELRQQQYQHHNQKAYVQHQSASEINLSQKLDDRTNHDQIRFHSNQQHQLGNHMSQEMTQLHIQESHKPGQFHTLPQQRSNHHTQFHGQDDHLRTQFYSQERDPKGKFSVQRSFRQYNYDFLNSGYDYCQYFNTTQTMHSAPSGGATSLPLPWYTVANSMDTLKKKVQSFPMNCIGRREQMFNTFQGESSLLRSVQGSGDYRRKEEVTVMLLVNFEEGWDHASFDFTVTMATGETNFIGINKKGLRYLDAPSLHEYFRKNGDTMRDVGGAMVFLEFLANVVNFNIFQFSDNDTVTRNGLPSEVACLFAEIIRSSGCETKNLTINSTRLTEAHSQLVKAFKPSERLEIHIQDLAAPLRVVDFFCSSLSLDFTMATQMDVIFIVRTMFEEWLQSTRTIKKLDVVFPQRAVYFTVDFLKDFVDRPDISPNKIQRADGEELLVNVEDGHLAVVSYV